MAFIARAIRANPSRRSSPRLPPSLKMPPSSCASNTSRCQPSIDGEIAATDETILHAAMGTNVVWNGVFEYGDIDKAFAEAAHVIHIDHLHMHRFSSTPLENNAVIAQWDDNDERLYFWSNNSFPTIGIQLLAPALHLRMDQVRVQTHDIGGSFGIKITNYPQMAVCALASRKANGAPIKWSETRTEHMTSSAHGNERTFRDTRVALGRNGVILAVDSRHIVDHLELILAMSRWVASSGRK